MLNDALKIYSTLDSIYSLTRRTVNSKSYTHILVTTKKFFFFYRSRSLENIRLTQFISRDISNIYIYIHLKCLFISRVRRIFSELRDLPKKKYICIYALDAYAHSSRERTACRTITAARVCHGECCCQKSRKLSVSRRLVVKLT